MLKKTICTMMIVLFTSGVAWAELDDVRLYYSTPGPDHYLDGTPVGDGECYALVYTRSGAQFAGFNRDGTMVNPEDSELILAAPSALNGACRLTMAQLPKDLMEARKEGVWSVFLLDTRGSDGVPVGLDEEGHLVRVNRYGLTRSSILYDGDDIASAQYTAASLMGATPEPPPGWCADTCAELPKDAPQPHITAIDVREDGGVTLTVENTVPYMSYGIDGGLTPSELNIYSEREAIDGKVGRPIQLETRENSPARFFKIVDIGILD